MGIFDPSTQRRTANITEAVLLPAAETLPQLAPGGILGLCAAIEKEKRKVERAMKRSNDPKGLQTLWNTMEAVSRKLADLQSFPAADRYMDLIYRTSPVGRITCLRTLLCSGRSRAGAWSRPPLPLAGHRGRDQPDLLPVLCRKMTLF